MFLSGGELVFLIQTLLMFMEDKAMGQASAVGSGNETDLLFVLEGKGTEVVPGMVNLFS